MTPAEFDAAMEDRGLRPIDAARALRVTKSAISHWRSGKNPIPGIVEVVLATIPLKNASRVTKTHSRKAPVAGRKSKSSHK